MNPLMSALFAVGSQGPSASQVLTKFGTAPAVYQTKLATNPTPELFPTGTTFSASPFTNTGGQQGGGSYLSTWNTTGRFTDNTLNTGNTTLLWVKGDLGGNGVLTPAVNGTALTSTNALINGYSTVAFSHASSPITAISSIQVNFNNAGGNLAHPSAVLVFSGLWSHSSTGSSLSGAGTLTIPVGEFVVLVSRVPYDSAYDILALSNASSSVVFLRNFSTRWYDNYHVAVLGNTGTVPATINYSIMADENVQAPVPVFFKKL